MPRRQRTQGPPLTIRLHTEASQDVDNIAVSMGVTPQRVLREFVEQVLDHDLELLASWAADWYGAGRALPSHRPPSRRPVRGFLDPSRGVPPPRCTCGAINMTGLADDWRYQGVPHRRNAPCYTTEETTVTTTTETTEYDLGEGMMARRGFPLRAFPDERPTNFTLMDSGPLDLGIAHDGHSPAEFGWMQALVARENIVRAQVAEHAQDRGIELTDRFVTEAEERISRHLARAARLWRQDPAAVLAPPSEVAVDIVNRALRATLGDPDVLEPEDGHLAGIGRVAAALNLSADTVNGLAENMVARNARGEPAIR